jgi:hypothetical protein
MRWRLSAVEPVAIAVRLEGCLGEYPPDVPLRDLLYDPLLHGLVAQFAMRPVGDLAATFGGLLAGQCDDGYELFRGELRGCA